MVLSESDLSRLEQAVLDFNDDFFTKGEVSDEVKSSSIWGIAQNVCNGKYVDALYLNNSPLAKILSDSKTFSETNSLKSHEILNHLRDQIEDALTIGNNSVEYHLGILHGGIASLMVFVQSNWTGPVIEQCPEDLIPGVNGKEALESLMTDGEAAYHKVVNPQYMALAKLLFLDNSSYIKHSKSVTWWAARFGFKLQTILAGPSETLRNFINAQFNKSMFSYSARPEILLEFGLVYHHYRDSRRAREYLLKAKAASKLYSELSGVMGRRTKFQTFDTAQLVLLAQSYQEGRDMPQEDENASITPSHFVDKDSLEAYLETPINSDAVTTTHSEPSPNPSAATDTTAKLLPSEIKPDVDDIRLTAPRLIDTSKAVFTDENLKIIDQCILLGLCLDVRNENPRHGLTSEQMKAYVERVMKHPNNWMVHSMALLIKSRLETHSTKYMDRAAIQLQVLVDQFKDTSVAKDYPSLVRSQRIFQVLYPPFHRLKGEIGDLYLKLGVARSALQIFEELEMWPEAISALQICGEDTKARALIKSRFEAVGEVPELLCLMGDVSADTAEKIQHYSRCWEVSKGKYPRAKRQLAKLAMDARDYAGAMEHYRQALHVNPQYGFAWFRMGCCALELQDWSQAQLAFTRVTYLHPDDAEAWSNLAATCLKLGKLKEAHSAFKEALKYNQDNWRIWDNYMVTCVKLGNLQESIYSLNKLLELNSSVDVDVLDILVKMLISRYPVTDPEIFNSSSSQYSHKQLRTLLGRITAKVSNNAELWDVYAKYNLAVGDLAKVVEFRQKQVRALQTHGWETEIKKFKKFKKLTEGLTELVTALEAANDKSSAYSAKLQVKSMLKKSEEAHNATEEYKTLETLVPRLEAIK